MMKRYLLSLIALACAVTGAWAEARYNVTTSGDDVTVTFDSSGTGTASNITLGEKGTLYFAGTASVTDVEAVIKAVYGSGEYKYWQTNIDMSGATISDIDKFKDVNNPNVTLVRFPSNTTEITADMVSAFTGWSGGSALNYIIIDSNPTKIYVYSGNYWASYDIANDKTVKNCTKFNISGNDESKVTEVTNTLTSAGKTLSTFDGKATVTGGSVQTGVEAVMTQESVTATEITDLTVSGGTLTDADVTYITGTLTGVGTLDLSGTTATGEQILSLLSSSHITSVTLGSTNLAALKAVTGKTITSAELAKIADAGMSTSAFIKDTTGHNFVISGSTLTVTGTLTDTDLTTITSILTANTGINTLDVSHCKNDSGLVTITDAALNNTDSETQVTTVNLPDNDYIKYDGTKATALKGGAVTINVSGQSLKAASEALKSTIASAEHIIITGTLTNDDLGWLYNLAANGDYTQGKPENAVTRTIDLHTVTLADGASLETLQSKQYGVAALLLPTVADTDMKEVAKITGTNVFWIEGSTLCGNIGTASQLSNATTLADDESIDILKLFANGASSALGDALKDFNVDILDFTDYNGNAGIDPSVLSDLSTIKTVLSPVSGSKLVVDGPLTDKVLETISSVAGSNTAITSIDFSGATVAEGTTIDWTKLSGFQNVEYICLPAKQDVTGLKLENLPKLKAAGMIDGTDAAINIYQEENTTDRGAIQTFSTTFTDGGVAPFNATENFKVYGQIDQEDRKFLSYAVYDDGFKYNLPALKLLDLSDATVEKGKLTELKQDNSQFSDYDKQYAIVLPTGYDFSAEELYVMENGSGDTCPQVIAYYTQGTDDDGSTYNKALNVFSYYGTNEWGDISALKSLVNEKMSLNFLPRINSTTDLTSFNYIEWPENNNVLTTLKDFNVGNIDFTYINISSLGTDFSMLTNENLHYLTIPTADQNKASIAYPELDNAEGFKFANNIYAVSTYKVFSESTAAKVKYSGITYTPDENTNVTYITPNGTGKLGGAKKFITDNMMNATRINVIGTVGASDLKALGDVRSATVDLTHATMADGVKATDLKSSYVRYLLLPNITAANTNTDLQVSAYNETNLTTAAAAGQTANCPNLYGIAQWDSANKKLYTHTTDRSVTFDATGAIASATNTNTAALDPDVYSVVDGKTTKVTMGRVEVLTTALRTSNGVLNVDSLVMSGYLNAQDISTEHGLKVMNVELLTFKATAAKTEIEDSNRNKTTVDTGVTVTGGMAADLSNAYFPTNADMNFSNANWEKVLVHVDLPTYEGNKVIPVGCFSNFQGLTDICIPYNYEQILGGAFNNGVVKHITTTDANGALIDNGDNTYTFSANLKVIGNAEGKAMKNTEMDAEDSPVFTATISRIITDVYALATTPTACPRGAFAQGMVVGWGGFTGGDFPYCRDKYVNNGFKFTLLHYPDQGTMKDEEYNKMEVCYTDTTRNYTKKDQTGAVDANGDALQWPSFAELCRSWNQAIRGKIWYDWDPGNDAVNGNPLGEVKNEDETTQPGNTNDAKNLEQDRTQNGFEMKYAGWHEFVLSQATYVPPTETVNEDKEVVREYVEERWYTFCIPFDMTEREVLELMGIPKSTEGKVRNLLDSEVVDKNKMPDIRTLKAVSRELNGSLGTVTLTTSENMADETKTAYYCTYYNPTTEKYDANTANTADQRGEKIVIRGGYPYLIKPYRRTTDSYTNLGEFVLSRYAFPVVASAVYRDGCHIVGAKEKEGVTVTGYKEGTIVFATPYTGHEVQAVFTDAKAHQTGSAVYKDENGTVQNYKYRFMGQFWQQPLPMYSYYISSKGNWNYYRSYHDNYYWKPYNCVINISSVLDEAKTTYYQIVGKDTYQAAALEGDLYLAYTGGHNDDFVVNENKTNARSIRIVFDDAIEELDENGQAVTAVSTLDGRELMPAGNGRVYDLGGRYVGDGTGGLRKGIYVVNGKKIVID